MSNGRTGYWVYYESDDEYDRTQGFKEFGVDELSKVVDFVNERPNWRYRVIWGTEHAVTPVTTITKLEVEA